VSLPAKVSIRSTSFASIRTGVIAGQLSVLSFTAGSTGWGARSVHLLNVA